jgi:OOP family OmpA-OmpF porin
VIGLLGACSAFAWNPAYAQNSGYYAGVSFGTSAVNACGIVPPGLSCDDKDSTFKIFGGYQMSRNFAVELGYADLGKVTASGPGESRELSSTAWEIMAVGIFPLEKSFSLFGKIGLFSATTNLTSTVGRHGDDTSNGVTFGLGARYNFTKTFGVRADWQRYMDVGGDNVGESDVDTLTIGVVVRF